MATFFWWHQCACARVPRGTEVVTNKARIRGVTGDAVLANFALCLANIALYWVICLWQRQMTSIYFSSLIPLKFKVNVETCHFADQSFLHRPQKCPGHIHPSPSTRGIKERHKGLRVLTPQETLSDVKPAQPPHSPPCSPQNSKWG